MLAVISLAVRAMNAVDLHVRSVANIAKQYWSEIMLHHNEIGLKAKFCVCMMGLDAFKGDRIQIQADGLDVNEAMIVVSTMIRSGGRDD